MTCVAWDGRTLAADKRTSFGGLHSTTIKVHKINGMLVAGAGSSALIQEMLDWLRRGADVEKFPTAQRVQADCASILTIHADGSVLQYENTPYPLVILNPYWALGSGRDFAMAAMHLGCSAKEAVDVACVFDSGCGNGVDTLNFE